MDPAVVPSGDDFSVFSDIQPVTSWADSIDDDEYEALDVVIPSWASTVKAEGPKASPPVPRRAENQSFVRREFRQKTKVWRKPEPSSYCRRSPPSGFIKRPEHPVREASQTQRRSPPSGYCPRQERYVREASPTRCRSPPSGFIKRSERPVGETSPTQRRSPPSWYCHRKEYRVRDAPPAQSRTPCSGFFNRQESPVKEASPQLVEKTPPSGSLKKRRPSLALYIPPKFRPPTSGSHPSGVYKDPAVTEASPSHHRSPPPGFFKRPDPPVSKASSQHRDSSISSSSTVNGVRPQEGQNTTAKTLPQTQGFRSPLRTDCSVDELCQMLDALHLSEKPTSLTPPYRPKPLLCPATFVFQEHPTFRFAQHQTVAGLKTWTKPPAPLTPEPAAEHLPAPYPNPRPCLLGKKHCRKRRRPSSDS